MLAKKWSQSLVQTFPTDSRGACTSAGFLIPTTPQLRSIQRQLRPSQRTWRRGDTTNRWLRSQTRHSMGELMPTNARWQMPRRRPSLSGRLATLPSRPSLLRMRRRQPRQTPRRPPPPRLPLTRQGDRKRTRTRRTRRHHATAMATRRGPRTTHSASCKTRGKSCCSWPGWARVIRTGSQPSAFTSGSPARFRRARYGLRRLGVRIPPAATPHPLSPMHPSGCSALEAHTSVDAAVEAASVLRGVSRFCAGAARLPFLAGTLARRRELLRRAELPAVALRLQLKTVPALCCPEFRHAPRSPDPGSEPVPTAAAV